MLEVLSNDYPSQRADGTREIIIKGLTTFSGNYGAITMTDYNLEYHIKGYDGRKVVDTFK